ncbi:MAG: FAD-dependent oxidoreductase, partial [Lachnospiraceae bacterium]|nr:FAD-dependent oxidoreductase [Lachnospiraceae bacterium]
IPGIEHAQGLLDTYMRKLPVGNRIVIIGGGLAGTEAAIEFARAGKTPVVLEMSGNYAAGSNIMHGFAINVEIEKYGIDIRTNTRCIRIAPGRVTCRNADGEYDLEADTVIYAAGMRARRDETDALRESCSEFESVGDCRKPAQIREAVTGGYFAAMNI